MFQTLYSAVPEREFARLDRLLAEIPRYAIQQPLMLFSQNKISLWLQQKTRIEQENSIAAALTTDSSSTQEKFEQRQMKKRCSEETKTETGKPYQSFNYGPLKQR